jgi:hypothetical protein
MKKILSGIIVLLSILNADVTTIDELCSLSSESKEGDFKEVLFDNKPFEVFYKDGEWITNDDIIIKPCSHKNAEVLFNVSTTSNKTIVSNSNISGKLVGLKSGKAIIELDKLDLSCKEINDMSEKIIEYLKNKKDIEKNGIALGVFTNGCQR